MVECAIRITTQDFRSRKVCARVSAVADPFNGHIDAFRIAHVQRSDGWIETTWDNMSDPGAFAGAGTEEQQGGEPPPIRGCLPDGVRGECRSEPAASRIQTGSEIVT